MSQTPFEPLNDALNVDYDGDELVKKAERDIIKLSSTTDKISDSTTLADKEYMEMELKTLIQSLNFVMERLEEDAKVGAKPRVFEVYATMAKAVLDAVKELRDLHLSIENIKLSKEKLEVKRNANDIPGISPNVSIRLTGKELFEMVNSAKATATKKESEIEAVYNVEDDN